MQEDSYDVYFDRIDRINRIVLPDRKAGRTKIKILKNPVDPAKELTGGIQYF